MSGLAIRVALAAAAATPPVGAPPAAQADAGFAALLGRMVDPKPSAAASLSEGAAKSKSDAKAADGAPAAEATTSISSALQSLEAALAGFGAPQPPAAGAPVAPMSGRPSTAAAPPAATNATGNASTLNSALATVAGALDGSAAGAARDSGGKTPLKALLQADPTLGLSDFQMKTHLAAAGATPVRVGPTTLGIDSAWHPLGAAPDRATGVGAAPAPAATAEPPPDGSQLSALASSPVASPAILETLGPSLAAPTMANLQPSPRAASQARVSTHGSPTPSSHTAALSPVASARAVTTVPPSATSADAAPHKDNAVGASDAALAATAAASADPAATPTLSLPLSQLPAFIAEQASTLAASAADASASTPSAAPAAQAKAAQAVKELHIALDPADLGQMTLKLRLAGGKLSVTIDVANPQTLAAIEGDRSLIASRIFSGDQTLEDLVIQRQAPSASALETVPAHASSNEPDSDNPSEHSGSRHGDPPRRGGGGAFSDLLV